LGEKTVSLVPKTSKKNASNSGGRATGKFKATLLTNTSGLKRERILRELN